MKSYNIIYIIEIDDVQRIKYWIRNTIMIIHILASTFSNWSKIYDLHNINLYCNGICLIWIYKPIILFFLFALCSIIHILDDIFLSSPYQFSVQLEKIVNTPDRWMTRNGINQITIFFLWSSGSSLFLVFIWILKL